MSAWAGLTSKSVARQWQRSRLHWACFRAIAVHALPEKRGFWRTLERAFRYHRKRPRGGPEAPASAPARAAKPGGDPPRFALYFNSHGNYFYREMALLMQAGLARAGQTCELRTERDGPVPGAVFHLVLAPHEFFYLAKGWNCFDHSYVGKLFLLNTEQPHTGWFQSAQATFFVARHVFDLSRETARLLQTSGLPASHLSLGYVEAFGPYDGRAALPCWPETEALAPAVREWLDTGRPLADRPLDLCFFGEASARRARLLASLAPVLQRFECYLRLKPERSAPWTPAVGAPDRPSRLTAGIARRSKIVLNLHRDEPAYFEWHRIVLMGLWHEALVVTEPVTDAAPFVAGRDFVSASASDLATTLDYYLRDPAGVAEGERIRQRGFQTLREECDFPRQLLEAWRPFL